MPSRTTRSALRAATFALDVIVPALTTVVLLSAALAFIYVEYLWVFTPE